MWKNREHIEEMLFLLEESHWPKLVQYEQLNIIRHYVLLIINANQEAIIADIGKYEENKYANPI